MKQGPTSVCAEIFIVMVLALFYHLCFQAETGLGYILWPRLFYLAFVALWAPCPRGGLTNRRGWGNEQTF